MKSYEGLVLIESLVLWSLNVRHVGCEMEWREGFVVEDGWMVDRGLLLCALRERRCSSLDREDKEWILVLSQLGVEASS